MTHSERLVALNLALPAVATPVGSYVPALRSGKRILTSGQLPMRDGKLLFSGKVPTDVSLEDAAEAARVCTLNGLAAAAEAAGGLDKITRVIRAGVFVNSSPDFYDQAKVANGASELLVEVFGEAGKHIRAAVGMAALPLNAAVEVEFVFHAV